MSCTDLLPASAIGVGNDIDQGIGQVAIAVEGIISSTEGNVGEIPVMELGEQKGRHEVLLATIWNLFGIMAYTKVTTQNLKRSDF